MFRVMLYDASDLSMQSGLQMAWLATRKGSTTYGSGCVLSLQPRALTYLKPLQIAVKGLKPLIMCEDEELGRTDPER